MFCRRSAAGMAALLGICIFVSPLLSARAADSADEDIAVAGDYAVVTRRVPTADLNLASPDDQRRLRHRLSVAARRACLEAGGATAIQDDSLLRCYEASMRQAWASVQDKILVASAKSHLIAGSQKQAPAASREVASSVSK